MKRLFAFLFFIASFIVTSNFTPVFAATDNAGGVGAAINYTGLWRGSDGKKQGIDAGTLPANKKCKPKGYSIELLCGPATVSFEAMSDAYQKETGQKLSAPSWGGYRTKQTQLNGGSTFAAYKANYAPPAHLWGTSIDFSTDRGTIELNGKEQKWLVQNGPKFGWYWPLWARPCSIVSEAQRKKGLCEGGGVGGHVEPWHFNYYYTGYDQNKYEDNLPSPFTGTAPGGGSAGGSSAATACAITKIGNAPGEPIIPVSCEGTSTTSNNNLVKAAQALHDAYVKCNGGKTYPGGNACMRSSLTASGFSDKQITAFESKRPGTTTQLGCTECLGFTSLALSLAYGDPSFLGYPTARAVYNSSSFKIGGVTYTKLPAGTAPQPGDVGMGTFTSGGHAMIVKSVQGSKVTKLEANYKACTATDDLVQPASDYRFFRPSNNVST